jgi:hypothetical protein
MEPEQHVWHLNAYNGIDEYVFVKETAKLVILRRVNATYTERWDKEHFHRHTSHFLTRQEAVEKLRGNIQGQIERLQEKLRVLDEVTP